MNIRLACKIFDNIDNEEFSVMEKGVAIYEVLKMPTHNSFTKDTMLKVMSWLWNQVFELEETKNE